VVIIYDSDETEGTRSISDSTGRADFNITFNRTDSTLTVTIQHPDFVEKTFTVDHIDQLASISRKLYFESNTEEPVVADSDGDGISDELDTFSDDPRYVSTNAHTYTIAYEDLYPEKGDADFNDLVVKLELQEYINAEDKISKIRVSAKVLASGAGYRNAFGITVLGEKYVLIEDAKAILNYNWDTENSVAYYDADPVEIVIEPDTPVTRSSIASMPYDPFCIANGVEENEVHLPFVTTDYEGLALDNDGFPWARLVPEDWQWPKEHSNIFDAYPDFTTWYVSGGTEAKDWYLNAQDAYVYNSK
jgi:hypothetical protein